MTAQASSSATHSLCPARSEQRREAAINNQLTSEEILTLRRELDDLRLEHRDLDDVINHLNHSAYPDQLQLKRLKKRKLRLKDMIQMIESRLIPDLDA